MAQRHRRCACRCPSRRDEPAQNSSAAGQRVRLRFAQVGKGKRQVWLDFEPAALERVASEALELVREMRG